MASVNKAIILGNCGRDPEMRYLANGDAALNMTVATNRKWKNKEGEQMEESEWHQLAFFGKLAEIAGEYLRKGDPVYVEGRLRTRKWDDKEGVTRYSTEVIVGEMQLLGGRRDGGEERTERPARQASSKPAASKPTPAKEQRGFSDDDSDIPF